MIAILLSLLAQGDVVQLRHRVVSTSAGEVEWYFWGADARAVVYGSRIGITLKVISMDLGKDKAPVELGAGRWDAAAMTGDGKRLFLLGRLWNGDDTVAELEDGKLTPDAYRSDTMRPGAVFSPDGKMLAYPAPAEESKMCVCVESVAEAEVVKRLAPNLGRIGRIVWSPDGKWLAFEHTVGDQREVWAVGADGTGLRNLTLHQAQDFSPTWSPDSKRVAFISDRDKGHDVYVIPVGGGPLQRATADGLRKADLAWSPKDNWIVARTYKDMKWAFIFSTAKGDRVRAGKSDARPHGPLLWSPKGDQFLYRSVLDTGEDALVVVAPPAAQ